LRHENTVTMVNELEMQDKDSILRNL